MKFSELLCTLFCSDRPDIAAPSIALPANKDTVKTLAWGNKVTPSFRQKVFDICAELDWTEEHANWLMACMAFESGRTFSPSVKNPQSSATGLIQFMSATAKGLGTSTSALAKMSAVEQLTWVKKYFQPYAKRITSLEDMYMAILWPKGVGKAMEYVLWKSGTRAYAVNKGLDSDKDGDVEKQEAARKVHYQLTEGMKPENVWEGML